jgi:hypothetical protein
MLIRYYQADYIDKSGKVRASYSFQAGTNKKAVIEAKNYKQKLGCEICKNCNPIVKLIGKVYPDPEPKRTRGRPPKHGINKFNR